MVVLRGTTTGGQVGVALNMILVANTTLVRLVQSWTNLEISLGAVSRLKGAEQETPREDQVKETVEPAQNWPSSGEVELRDVTAAYKYVLKFSPLCQPFYSTINNILYQLWRDRSPSCEPKDLIRADSRHLRQNRKAGFPTQTML